MNRLIRAASIIAFVAPSIVAAQPANDQHHQNQHQGRPQNAGGGQQAPRAARQGGGHQQTQQAPQLQAAPSGPGRAVRQMSGRAAMQAAPNYRSGARSANIQPVRAPAFRYPRGYNYRRWTVGLVLPSVFLSNYYFYNNWAAVGAYPPPPGFVWVRNGPDLLLVSRRTGRIRDVIYGAFY